MRKKQVLLLSEAFGTGHTQAAYALAVGMKQLSPQVQTRVIELGKFLNPTVGPLIISAYRKTVSTKPELVGRLYRNKYKKPLNRITQLALHRIFYAQAANVIRQLKPDMIVCTHPFPSIVISRLKRLGLDIPLFTLITDYDAHGTWINPEVNKFLVSTPRVKELLLSRGIHESRIEVTGIPVHPNFWIPHQRDELRVEFGLKPLPTVMVMGGGWGLVFDEDLLTYMTTWRDQVQFIFCMGSNQKMIQKMKANPKYQHPNIHILGYTHEIHKLMDVSDLLISKPGGMTCTEGLVKRIPMLFYDPIPGQEEENCEYFVQHGHAEMLESHATLEKWFNRLVVDYETVTSRRIQQMNQVSASSYEHPAHCSHAVLDLLR
ncbi:UDP-N-acetylglucosamine--LPS N-acetylglucosamine transferase [Paenibacillus selenitireducens]|uniref:UDP-N-acetylglucosamine--LPS N-acetylglucosamine transferase n=1 Tax=Paenibacillus selenitireducens TaxID=1324314 RepID=A0A1T2X2M6_9BACL|nr:glycosyltransferase [Paenibacillus selenitireducens]OPA74124.1 UDP-N-acetylglucosamine--LPS N-acetylglucosamine transferase [Paenibacillus selenitireducens]